MYLLFALFLVPGLAAHPASGAATTSAPNVTNHVEPVADSVYSVASTRYTYELVANPGVEAWQNRDLTVESFFSFGTVVLDLSQQVRFGRNEISGTGHHWVNLWGASYAHFFTSIAPNALTMPENRIGGELYEVQGNLEMSGWFEWRNYAESSVHVIGPQIGYYLRGAYATFRTSIVERSGTWVAMQIGSLRYYLGSPDSFVQTQAGFGKNIELVEAAEEATDPFQVSRAYFGTLRVRYFFTRAIGGSLTFKYSNATYQRLGATGGLMVRW